MTTPSIQTPVDAAQLAADSVSATAATVAAGAVRTPWKEFWRKFKKQHVAVIALLLLSLAVLVQFWDSPQRVLVAWLLAGGWLLAWVAVAVALVSIGRQAGNAFALTRRELQQDWRTIKEQL